MAKKLSPEEKQYRIWKKDEELRYALQCSKCGCVHEIMFETDRFCKCGNVVYKNNKPNTRACKILYPR